MRFSYEAMTSDGRLTSDGVEAANSAEAAENLRAKGLTVLRLEAARGGEKSLKGRSPAGGRPRTRGSGAAKPRDLMLFTQQLKMLLEAGAALVPALEAIEQQTAKESFAAVVHRVREHVEQGGTLSEALQERPNIFKPVFCSMVSAGEATASLPQTFDRLNEMTVRQQQLRKTLLGALLYPMILSVLCLGVAGVVVGFIVPRFRDLFVNLKSPLPASTQVMFAVSEQVRHNWPVLLGVLLALVAGLVVTVRTPSIRQRLDTLVLRMPMIGPAASRLLFARVLRIWAAMLRCHVPLLEAIQYSKSATTNAVFLGLVNDVEASVASGGSLGRTLAESGLVEPVVASAIRTGEENGRLTEAVEFVSAWIDDDNGRLVTGLARVAEPALLAVMGLFVGLVAMSLFIPMFDLAAAGG